MVVAVVQVELHLLQVVVAAGQDWLGLVAMLLAERAARQEPTEE